MSESAYSKLSEILPDIDLPDTPPQFNETKLFQDWSAAAGETIANSTLNLSISGNVIAVTVSSPIWAHELINNQSTILARLIEAGYKSLQEMTVRVSVSARRTTPRSYGESASRSSQPAVTPKLQKLFVEIAEKSNNPKTRETFLRLSKIQTTK